MTTALERMMGADRWPIVQPGPNEIVVLTADSRLVGPYVPAAGSRFIRTDGTGVVQLRGCRAVVLSEMPQPDRPSPPGWSWVSDRSMTHQDGREAWISQRRGLSCMSQGHPDRWHPVPLDVARCLLEHGTY